MRQQNSKWSRNRPRKGGPNLAARTLDSNGPDIKIRGTPAHICKRYQGLARDAQAAGDRIRAENYLQHAEHYYRIVLAAQAAEQAPPPDGNAGAQQGFGPRENRGFRRPPHGYGPPRSSPNGASRPAEFAPEDSPPLPPGEDGDPPPEG